jgi:hypothetical protein
MVGAGRFEKNLGGERVGVSIENGSIVEDSKKEY